MYWSSTSKSLLSKAQSSTGRASTTEPVTAKKHHSSTESTCHISNHVSQSTANSLSKNHSRRQNYSTKGNARYNLQRQKTTGMKIPIATATGTSMLLESSVAYGSVTRGSAIRRRLLGSVDVSRSSSSASSVSSGR